MRSAVCVLAGLFLSACPLTAAKPTAWTIDDVVLTESIRDIQVSPDGRWAVWLHHAPDKDKGEEVANLVRLDLADGRETVLTRGAENCLRPRWSPDGRRLAFLRTRADDEKSQLWLLDSTGGEPWPLTDWSPGVLLYDWAGPDALVFAAPEEATLRATTLKEDKDDSVVVEDDRNEPPVRLFRVEMGSKKVTRLSDNGDRIEKLAVSPDGRHAVAIHNRSLRYVYDNKIKPAVFLYELATGRRRPVFRAPHWNIQHVRWAPDSKGFYAANWHNSRPQLAQTGILRLHYFDLARAASTPIDLGWDRGLGEQDVNDEALGFAVTRDGFFALLADGVRNKLARYRRSADGWQREWLTGEHAANVFGLQTGADGRTLFYAYSTASTPTQWYRAELDGTHLGKPRSFAVLNEHLRRLPRAAPRLSAGRERAATRWKASSIIRTVTSRTGSIRSRS